MRWMQQLGNEAGFALYGAEFRLESGSPHPCRRHPPPRSKNPPVHPPRGRASSERSDGEDVGRWN